MNDSDPVTHHRSTPVESRSGGAGSTPTVTWRQRRWMKRTLRMALALCAFVLLFSWIGDIGSLSIHRPFDYYGDSLEVLAMARDRIANDYDTRLRAPFELSKPE